LDVGGSSLSASRKLAERICATIRTLDLAGTEGPVTVSIGVAESLRGRLDEAAHPS